MKRLVVLLIVIAFVECQRRIFGGKNATSNDFGHVVLLQTTDSKCTGCIIHEQWVLSAAHCVSRRPGDVVRPTMVTVVAGSVNLDLSNAQVRVGKKIYVHDDYMLTKGKLDLSLIQVNETFDFNKAVKKLGFNVSPWPQTNKGVWVDCVSAGWGLTENGKTTDLKYMPTSARHGKKSCPCIKDYKPYVCLPTKALKGICFGDSGGALVCGGKIVGVAHAVLDKRTCSSSKKADPKINCGSRYVYGIYIYTCPYLNWISGHVPNIPATPESCAAERSPFPFARQTVNITICIVFISFYLTMNRF